MPAQAVCLWKNTLLCAIRTHILCVIVVHPVCVAPIVLWAFWHLSCHCHPNDFQPALLVLLRFSSEVVDRLGLGNAEAGWRVRGPCALIHRVTQEGDGRLGLNVLRGRSTVSALMPVSKSINEIGFLLCPSSVYLWGSVEVEHQTFLLGDDAPHLLPWLILLTVLQEAAYDAAVCELSCLDLCSDTNHKSGHVSENPHRHLYTDFQLTSRMPFFLPSVTVSPISVEKQSLHTLFILKLSYSRWAL